MQTVTSAEMKKIDKQAIEDFGIPGIVLMENAGRAVAQAAEAVLRSQITDGRTVHVKCAIICGSGNNGGDGLVAARHLYNHGYGVELILLKPGSQFKGDSMTNYTIVNNLKIPVMSYSDFTAAKRELREFSLIIDALLGTGVSGEVTGEYCEIINVINASQVPVIAVDVPSGLDCDTGAPLPTAVQAAITVTMGLAKQGLLMLTAKQYVGNLQIADISLPRLS